LQVRTLHFSDFLKLGRLHQADIGLNLPFALVNPDLPLPAALTQHLPVNSLNSSVYIYEEKGRPQAFVQARAHQRRDEWEVLSLGVIGKVRPELIELPQNKPEISPDGAGGEANDAPPSLAPVGGSSRALDSGVVRVRQPETDNQNYSSSEDDFESDQDDLNDGLMQVWPVEIEMAWSKLLEHLVKDAGEKGVVRLFARLATDSPQLELFNQLGFHAYTHETLFHLQYNQPVDRPDQLSSKVREHRNRDTWFIHQLYNAITPTPVQNTEQNTSRSWEIHRAYLPRQSKESGLILMEGEKAVAYIRILSHRNRHLMRIMHLDTSRHLLPDLIQYALSTLKTGAGTDIYCAVREYQMEQEAVLEELGFQRVFGKQAVLVKHTVQFVRGLEKQLVRGRESKLELAHRSFRPGSLVRFIRYIRCHWPTLLCF
jgi:hypothetical protein